MKKFENIKTINSNNFYAYLYSIEEVDGVKYIHIFGCIWADDGRIHEDEYVGFMEPLADFVNHLNEDADYVENKIETLTQYGEDMEVADAVWGINNYFGGKGADYILDMEDVTTDTPIGDYIDQIFV